MNMVQLETTTIDVFITIGKRSGTVMVLQDPTVRNGEQIGTQLLLATPIHSYPTHRANRFAK